MALFGSSRKSTVLDIKNCIEHNVLATTQKLCRLQIPDISRLEQRSHGVIPTTPHHSHPITDFARQSVMYQHSSDQVYERNC
jgi:hypothetical protein